MSETEEKEVPNGWGYHATDRSHFEAFVDHSQKHSGSRCATLRSVVDEPEPFGNLMQSMGAAEYQGKRLRMSAWVKTNIEKGTSQLWIRIDGDWKSSAKEGCFDNMDDRPIKGQTDWTKYELVVQVPAQSTAIAFGVMLIGKGQIWFDDVSFEEVDESVALTGAYVNRERRKPKNLNFEN